MRILLFTAAFCAPLFAAAAAETSTHQSVKEIDVENFIGTVKIETVSGGGVSLERIEGKDADYPVHVTTRDGVLMISSDEDPDDIRWQDDVNWRKHHEDAFRIFLEDYPTLTLRIPVGIALDFDSAVIMLSADDTRGALSVREGHIIGAVGDLASADITIHGSGDLKAGDIEGDFKTAIYGSGDLTAKSAGTLNAKIHGSGDIVIGDIGGPASLDIHGSGDITLGRVDGALDLSIQGSGDVEADDVEDGAMISIHGSGDVALASLRGRGGAEINGSGDIEIDGGRVDNLLVEIRGSGGFEFDGVAVNPTVYAGHSGSVHIARHEGDIRARGDGDIEISGVQYGDDD